MRTSISTRKNQTYEFLGIMQGTRPTPLHTCIRADTFARAGGSRGVSRNSSSNDDVNPRPIHLFWLLLNSKIRFLSAVFFFFILTIFGDAFQDGSMSCCCCSLLHISLKISIVSDSQLSRRPKKHKKEKERKSLARYCRV